MDSKKLELIKLKVDILKMKADDYNWKVNIPNDVQIELEQILSEINEELTKPQEPIRSYYPGSHG